MSTIGSDDKKGHIAALIQLAKADGSVSQHEVNLIKLIAIRMGISSNDFNEVVISAESIQSSAPESKEEKELYLYNLLSLMKVDLSTDDNEQKVAEELCLRLGFTSNQVATANNFMTKNLDNVISFEDFSKEINK